MMLLFLALSSSVSGGWFHDEVEDDGRKLLNERLDGLRALTEVCGSLVKEVVALV